MRIIVASRSDGLDQLVQYIAADEPEIEVIDEAGDVGHALQLVAELKPDWIFLLQEEFDRAYHFAEQLLAIEPELDILVVSEDGRHRHIRRGRDGEQIERDWDRLSTSEFIHVLKRGEYPQAQH